MMEPIVPMEPKSSSTIPEGNGWLAQVKWDGVRILTYGDQHGVRLFNRKRRERTFHYPEITDLASYCLADSVVLDGEVIALGEDGKPSFHQVMRRDGITRMENVSRMKQVVPITYMIFDVLYLNGKWITRTPLGERVEILASIIKPDERIQPVASHDDAKALFSVVREYGMEGIVVKRTNSYYYPGQEKEVWLKIKNYRDLIAVVGGFTLRGVVVNAILLGLYDQKGNLWYIGHTGAGKMTQEDWRKLTERLRLLVVEKRPFVNRPERHRDAYWVKPRLTVKVRYAEWTEGGSLRQPTIEGFIDAAPEDCVFNKNNEGAT